jgi:hypothetical protein
LDYTQAGLFMSTQKRGFQIYVVPLFLAAIAGCSQQTNIPSRTTKSPPPPQQRTAQGNVSCRVSGTVSSSGKLSSVVIYVKDPVPVHDEVKVGPTLLIKHLDSKYVPRVSAARVGQLIEVVNEGKELHTNHVLSLFNKQKGAEYFDPKLSRFTFTEPEIFLTLQCDLHKEERAHIAVFDHPFFGVSGEDGAYELSAPLPSGKYTLEANYGVLGVVQKVISISNEPTMTVDFQFNGSK